MNVIRMIEIERLYAHPDNPRKDVGDVTELSDSIKHSGIMQNLTVVPFEDGYRVVIGHRRLAASKMAGLTQLPCIVSDMDYKEQIATMFSENMQRVDLTTPEQAQGIQMMLDLGESVKTISDRTGFSESTVRKRAKIAKLPFDKLKQAEERGGTLEDYIKCCEIEDEGERARLIDLIGTRDFEWRYTSALRNQKIDKIKPAIIEQVKKIATEIKPEDRWSSKYENVVSIDILQWEPGEPLIKKYDEGEKYFWCCVGNGPLCILKKAKKKAVVKKSKKEIEANRRRDELSKLFKKAFEMRKAFVLNFTEHKKYEKVVLEYLLYFLVMNEMFYTGKDISILKQSMGDESKAYYPAKEKALEWLKKDDLYAMLVFAYYYSADKEKAASYCENHGENMPQYRKSTSLEKIYEFLANLGYQISTEEQQLLDGTHELYGGASNA